MPILLFYKDGTPALMYSQHFRVIYFNVVDQQGYEGEPLSLSLQSIFGCFNCCSRPLYHCVYVDIGPMDSIQSLGFGASWWWQLQVCIFGLFYFFRSNLY